ncbi:MAG: hypothetical protein M5U25_13160 [Planctomycetota bacterium]|nr:hypothetical protein [Planctomycetota bacterium]
MRPGSTLSLAVLLLGLTLAPALGAATIVWSGAGDGTTWSQGANWVGGVAPTAADEASFDGTSATAPTTVTGLTNTLQRITVNSGASANLNLTLVMTGNVTLVGTGGASLFLGAGDAVTFQSDSATVRTMEIQADVDSSGGAGTSYTFADTITLNPATNTVSLVVRDQSALNVQGLLDVDTDTNLQVNNTTGTSVVSLNDIDLGDYLMPDDTGGSPVVTVAGDIVYSADASAWDDDNISGTFTVNLNGSLVDFNNHENLEFDFDQSRVVVGGTLVLQDVATITTWSAPPRFDYLTVNAAASLTFPDGLPTSPSIFVNNDLIVNGTLNFGDNDFVTYGSVVTVGAGGSLAASASPGTFVVQGNVLFTGTFTMPLDFYCWQDSLVALGSDVTFAGTVTVNNCDFGADQDGATTTSMATLRFNGNFAVTTTGRLDVGEGNHYFGADIDLSAADDRVIGPSTSNTDPTVHLTGAAQAIDFSAGGSLLHRHLRGSHHQYDPVRPDDPGRRHEPRGFHAGHGLDRRNRRADRSRRWQLPGRGHADHGQRRHGHRRVHRLAGQQRQRQRSFRLHDFPCRGRHRRDQHGRQPARGWRHHREQCGPGSEGRVQRRAPHHRRGRDHP